MIFFIYLLKGPAADATDARITVMKMMKFFPLFHFNGAPVE
jgi:hypothetical protein